VRREKRAEQVSQATSPTIAATTRHVTTKIPTVSRDRTSLLRRGSRDNLGRGRRTQHPRQDEIDQNAYPGDDCHDQTVDAGFGRINESPDGLVRQAGADEGEAHHAEQGSQRFAPFETVRVLLRCWQASQVARAD
jgi:hypothetical protein